MKNLTWLVLPVLAALVCVTACSDDDGSVLGTGPTEFSNAAVSSVMSSNVLPGIESVAFTLGFMDQFAAVAGGDTGPEGVPICSTEACSSGGSATICQTPTGGIEVEFVACGEFDGRGSITLDGSLAGACTESATVVACNLEVDLQVDFSSSEVNVTLALFGSLSESFDLKTGCSAITRSDYGISVLGDSTSMSGTLQICEGDLYPTGQKTVTVISQLHGAYFFDMRFDGSNVVVVTVFDHNSGNLLGSCNVDFDTGSSECGSA